MHYSSPTHPRLFALSAAAVLVGAAVASTGCASLSFEPKVESIGEFRDMSAVSEKAEKVPASDASRVRAITGTLPEGMELQGETLRVDTSRYEMLGKVNAEYNNATLNNLGWWVYPYAEEESWRYGYCGWQVPLSWVTLTMWAWVTPFHYPCKVSAGDDKDRRDAIVKTLQKATIALGGDTLVFAFGGLSLVNAHTGQVLSTTDAVRGEGYALRSLGNGAAKPASGPVQSALPRSLDLTRPPAPPPLASRDAEP